MLWGIKYTAFVSEVLLMSQLLTFKLLEWDCGRYDYSIRSCMRCIREVGQGALEVQYSFGGLPRWQTRCYHAKYYLSSTPMGCGCLLCKENLSVVDISVRRRRMMTRG